MNPSRRRFLFGASAALVAAPAAAIAAIKAAPIGIRAFGAIPDGPIIPVWRYAPIYGRSPAMDALGSVCKFNQIVEDASRWHGDEAGIPIKFRGFEALKTETSA